MRCLGVVDDAVAVAYAEDVGVADGVVAEAVVVVVVVVGAVHVAVAAAAAASASASVVAVAVAASSGPAEVSCPVGSSEILACPPPSYNYSG